jgi:hypothetical protein
LATWGLSIVAEVTFLLKGFSSRTKSLQGRKNLHANTASQIGRFLSTTLSKIWLSVGSIFTVLPITPSLLVRFLPVKCQIEALNMLYTLVRGWSVQSGFQSGQRFGQTLVKLGQPWSKLVERLQIPGNVSRATF